MSLHLIIPLVGGVVVFGGLLFYGAPLLCAIAGGVIAAVLLAGFGGFGVGGGKGDGVGSGMQEQQANIEKKLPDKELIVKVNRNYYIWGEKKLKFNEFQTEIDNIKPKQIILDYDHKYKAVHAVQFSKLVNKYQGYTTFIKQGSD